MAADTSFTGDHVVHRMRARASKRTVRSRLAKIVV